MNSWSPRAAWIGMAVAALTTLPGLGVGTLWDNSETAYGEVAREILLTGNAIVMHLNGAPWFVQPPLYFWVAALCAKILGVGTLAMRLPAALATIIMGGIIGWFAERTATRRAALFACVISATALMQAVIGRLAIMDALLDCAVMAALVCAFISLREGSKRAWYAAWVAAALGVLAKGPVAPVVVILVVGVWLVWEYRVGGKIVPPSWRAWTIGVAAFAAIILPWFVLVARAAGPTGVRELIGHYTVGRYMGAIENQSGPVWYYVPVVILGFFPWIAFLAPACVAAWKNVGRSEASLQRFYLAWAVAPFIFFSFAQTKLPNYLALELPALALLTALWFDEIVDEQSQSSSWRGGLVWASLVPVLLGVMGVAVAIFSRNNRLEAGLGSLVGDMVWIVVSMLVGAVACFGLLALGRVQRFHGVRESAVAAFAPYALGAGALGAMLIIAYAAEPHAERFKPIPVLSQVIQRERRAGDEVAIWGAAGSNALVFYTRPRVIEFTRVGEREQVRAVICSSKRLFMVMSKKRAAMLGMYVARRRRELLSVAGDVLYLYDGPSCV